MSARRLDRALRSRERGHDRQAKRFVPDDRRRVERLEQARQFQRTSGLERRRERDELTSIERRPLHRGAERPRSVAGLVGASAFCSSANRSRSIAAFPATVARASSRRSVVRAASRARRVMSASWSSLPAFATDAARATSASTWCVTSSSASGSARASAVAQPTGSSFSRADRGTDVENAAAITRSAASRALVEPPLPARSQRQQLLDGDVTCEGCELLREVVTLSGAETRRLEPTSEEPGQLAAPFWTSQRDPPGGVPQDGVGRTQQWQERVGGHAIALNLVPRDERRAARTRGRRLDGRNRGGIADLDQRVRERMLEHGIGRSGGCGNEVGTTRASPMRPSASAAARCKAGRLGTCRPPRTICGNGRAITPEAGGMDRGLAHVRRPYRRARAHGLPRLVAVDARQRPDRVSTCLDGPRAADHRGERGHRGRAGLARTRTTRAARRMALVMSRSAARSEGDIVLHGSARPRGIAQPRRGRSAERGKSRQGPGAWQAATSGSRACTRDPCRRRADCRRHPR